MAISGEIRTYVVRFATARARAERGHASLWDRIARAYALFTSAAELGEKIEVTPPERQRELAASWFDGAIR